MPVTQIMQNMLYLVNSYNISKLRDTKQMGA
jgi:hypothetical protein